MKTYLVTGAAGFVGSKLAEKLLKAGNTVVTVDNLSTGTVENIPDGTRFIHGNCQDQSVIDRLYSWKFDAVFHVAGQSSGEISYDDPVYDLQTNTQSTLQLLQLCLKTGCKKFIYASSMSVYGDVDESKMPVKESEVMPTPKSFYGVGKLASEHYLRIYAEQFGIATASLRLFNIYGPGQNLTNLRQGMVSIFLAQALNNGHIHVKGSADRYRDFIYIDDVVEAFETIAENAREGEHLLLNVSSGVKTKVSEVVESIISELGQNITVQYEGSTPGDQFGIYGSPEAAVNKTNWLPKVSFNEGMKNMISWAIC
ncbi:MAG: NAD-dependent epimerase/dehydratase family protein [Balneolales bacterium]|nr:NAD-dependent epimerase/dehydratase family protein [Balneolales bacterium]